jgi:phage terminase large subunit
MSVQTVELEIPEKLIPVLDTKARYIGLVGGRGSAKSESTSRITTMKAESEGSDLLCGREYQNSIDDSVHKLNCEVIEKLGIPGAYITDKKIDFASGGTVRYKGFARNSAAVKSAQGFKRSWVEEAQDLSQESITHLLPTIRAKDSQLLFTANPQASNDPFSQRFIVPFMEHLDRYGYYSDDLHLIIKINWRDNPWHGELEPERQWDYEHKSRAEYDHIWEGAFNDTVENSIIDAEWFDAAIDAHLRLGWKPRGAKKVAHDPSDTGKDTKGLVLNHGNVILDVRENDSGDVNEGCDWAIDYAISVGADMFVWDCDGLGVSLRRQVSEAFAGTRTQWVMFKGSESPSRPEEVYQPDVLAGRAQARKNKDTFKNKRAQRYWQLRDRFYATYRAVVKGEYIDPSRLISISSKIKCLTQFRSEICRIPKKANGQGFIQIMRKDEMKNNLKIASPNLADSAMMAEEEPPEIQKPDTQKKIIIPNMRRL